MDTLISNAGFDLINRKIAQNLDYSSLRSLSRVSSDFHCFIENDRTIWLNQARQLKNIEMLDDEIFNQICAQFDLSTDVQEVKRWVHIMKKCVQFNVENEEYICFPFLEFQDILGILFNMNDKTSIKFLLELYQHKLDYENSFWFALEFDCMYGQVEFLQTFDYDIDDVDSIDVNVTNNNGETPLICATVQGEIEVVKFLLGIHGIKINATNVHGNTAMDLARENGHFQIVDLLVQSLMKTNQPYSAVGSCIQGDVHTSFAFQVLREM